VDGAVLSRKQLERLARRIDEKPIAEKAAAVKEGSAKKFIKKEEKP
jgi:hypothetical protein